MNRDFLRNYNQYLERYAEPEARALKHWLTKNTDVIPRGRSIVSIPLCCEHLLIQDCLQSLTAAAENNPAIVIFVVNNRSTVDTAIKRDNMATLNYLSSKVESSAKIADNISFAWVTPRLAMVVVDRSTTGSELPEHQGVGMARKIGCDLGTVLIAESYCADRFIRNTDGDARVGLDFFAPIAEGPAAAIFPFVHHAKKDGVDAVLQYEQYLYYYVRGLAFAGSTYAFHTIGSTIACSSESYISCRGFPKREAGEDFYLLNKLAKVGQVINLDREPLQLVSRDSDRVPFGTGAACRRIEGLVLTGGIYQVYHPDCFRFLKVWLAAVSVGLEQKKAEAAWQHFTAESKVFSAVSVQHLAQINQVLHLESGFAEVLKKSPRSEVLLQHARIWFDGFRTMRFLNLARDFCFGEVPVTEAALHFFKVEPECR